MGMYKLDKIFKPRSVAVIGASPRANTIGNALIKNLIAAGFDGMIYPINPRHTKVEGLRTYARLTDIEAPVDLVVMATPLNGALATVEECIAKAVGGLVIIAAGGKESGEAGRRLEMDIKTLCARHGLRVIGPNCMGIICSQARLNASFAAEMPSTGHLAVISQSGALCTAILDISLREKIGFSHFISIGSMLDVDFGDLIDYLGQDPQVTSIVLYIENLTHIRKFMSAARRVTRVKPIVALKAGRSPAGARAAASHTGAMTGEDAIYQAAFKRAGIVQVDTFEELFDCAELMAKQPLPKGAQVAVLTNGGGAGVMAADALARHQLAPAELSAGMFQQLNQLLPPYWSRGNPIDILGDATPERWQAAVRICLAEPEIQALIIIFLPQALTDARAVARAVAEAVQRHNRFPVFAVWMGSENVAAARDLLNQAGIATYDSPERAVAAFAHLHAYARNLELSQEAPPKFARRLQFDRSSAAALIDAAKASGHSLLTEIEAKSLLQTYGLPVIETRAACTAREAVEWFRRMQAPVVLKILSRQITHKTDVDGIRLNLTSEEAVHHAFEAIVSSARRTNPEAELQGVTVQPMVVRSEAELILGCKQDPEFGPVILFGAGGTLTEIFQDRALGLPPLNRLLARHLIEETRIFKLLQGFRGRPAADLVQLEETLVRISQLCCDFPEISELDINPLLIRNGSPAAVDARAVLKPSVKKAPMHLVISPYPNQYERQVQTKDGLPVFIRPIMPEDAPLLEEMFTSLSYRTIYNRFFRPIKVLSPAMMAMLTQIDYERDMGLIALDARSSNEKMLGMARIISDVDVSRAEFAVLVADPWQGKGIGAELLKHLITIALDKKLRHLWGCVLTGNSQMLALARKLGFAILPGEDSEQFEMRIELSTVRPDSLGK